MAWKVPLADLDYGPEEERAVIDVLRSKWLTMGAVTQSFEGAFAALTGARHAMAVSNATQALHLACLALGIGPGDEVIVPSLTFVATANAVLYCGADVRFAEVLSSDNLTVDPVSIEACITPRTKAVIPMHYAGYPCRMPEIMALAEEHGLAVIEDAAHAPGATLDGRALGTFGEVGCFSFFSNKNLPTGEGGMLVTDRDDLAAKLRLLRSHGMTTLTYDRHKGHAFSYDVVELGYNYRIDEIRASLGLTQLAKLADNNAKRRLWTRSYWDALADLPVALPFKAADQGTSAYHLFPMLLPEGTNREAFMASLRDAGVQSSIHYRPVHTFSYYRERYGEISLPVTEALAAREVTLPLYPTMGEAGLGIVVEAATALLAHIV
ncbi:MAG: DegT/DnrJ/EryC1/StrS family aminotransferase [Brevefilum sp.]|nr:DegT/DnrJ/EryC1/StrS family aminotransferase [Brevefilum sp.]